MTIIGRVGVYVSVYADDVVSFLFRTYKNVANYVAKGGYRPDLRQAAIARASAVRKSQRPVKSDPEKKLRGKAAKRAAAQE